MKHLPFLVVIVLLALCQGCGLRFGGGPSPPNPNKTVQVTIVNDKPQGTAQITMCFCGMSPLTGTCPPFNVSIDSTGTGIFVKDTGDTCPVSFAVVCADGQIRNANPALFPSAGGKATVNCGFTGSAPPTVGWQSIGGSLDILHLDVGPEQYSSAAVAGAQSSSLDVQIEGNRESVARGFLGEQVVIDRTANVLYSWLLGQAPPDSSVAQSLAAGSSVESQVVSLVSGQQFFASSNSDNAAFVSNAYQLLLNRTPAQWESSSAVNDLNGYWIWVQDPCEPPPCTSDGYCPDPPKQGCGHYEWYQLSRAEFAWQIVDTHEFGQVAAAFTVGVQLRRAPTSTEIEDQATYVNSYGLREAAVRLLKSSEFLSKSPNPW